MATSVKEIKLKKNGAMVSPIVLIDSLRNLDGTKYKDTVAAALNGKADISHDHNGSYYTKTETINLLNGKADSVHSHDYAPKTTHAVSYTEDESGDYQLSEMSVGELRVLNLYDTEQSRNVKTPRGGTYVWSENSALCYGQTVSGNTVFSMMGTHGVILRIS